MCRSLEKYAGMWYNILKKSEVAMKKETMAMLLNEIQNNPYSPDDWEEYSFDGLFQKYLALEVCSVDDLTHGHMAFVDFILENFDKMDKSNLEGGRDAQKYMLLKSDLQSVVKDYSALNVDNSTNYFAEQEVFATLVNRFVPKDKVVLDVGCGKIPLSSSLIASGRDKPVIAMDSRVNLPNEAMERLNLIKSSNFFDMDTILDGIDVVVGDKPCTAIESIVKKSSQEGKQYLLRLCDCYAPDQKMGVDSWGERLKGLDDRIVIDRSGEFVTNLPISQKYFSDVVEALKDGKKLKPVCEIEGMEY